MKRLIAFLCILLLTTAMAYAGNYEVHKKTDGYVVDIKIDKSTPVVGNNGLEISVKDADGKQITDAKVAVNYSMPAMSGMPAMNYKANAELKGDKYQATMDLSMSGSWSVSVKISHKGKMSTVKFNVDAR